MPTCHTVKRNYLVRCSTRVCLKIAFRQMCVTLCGRFGPDEGGVAGYVDRIGTKYAAKWGVQMVGMNFHTHPGMDCITVLPSQPEGLLPPLHGDVGLHGQIPVPQPSGPLLRLRRSLP